MIRVLLVLALLLLAKAAAAVPLPARLSECEEKGCGGDWQFSGRAGRAHWPNGVEAELAIERFDEEQVVIRREDVSTMTLGVTAVYVGQLRGRRVEGEVTYSWPGRWPQPVVVTWHAIIEAAAARPPAPAMPVPPPRVWRTSGAAAAHGLDLSGVWQAKVKGGAPPAEYATVQEGARIVVFRIRPGEPVLVFRGQFDGDARIAGHNCTAGRHPGNPNCLPQAASITVIDASHVKDSGGGEYERIAPPDDPRVAEAAVRADSIDARPFLRKKPFDIAGTWQSDERPDGLGQVTFTQADGLVTMSRAAAKETVVFSGRYEANPVFSGIGKSARSLSVDVPWSIFVEDPDHLRINAEGASHPFHRLSAPRFDDPPCDTQNRQHVDAAYAMRRGQGAASRRDDAATACWLSVSASRQPPDYELAFEMATRSAQQGDVGGQILLAQLYRDGKGTAPDSAKATYWFQQAERTKQVAQQQQAQQHLNASIAEFYRVLLGAVLDVADEERARQSEFPKQCHQTQNGRCVSYY
jgi:hypothetical protein